MSTRQAANAAGVSSSFDRAQKSTVVSLRKVFQGGFGKFIRIVPTGGIKNTGAHIWIVRTDINNGSTEYLGPDFTMPDGPDLLQYVYEYRVTTRQDVGPLVPLPIGLIADVPGLSSPCKFDITCCAQAEHPDGLSDFNRITASSDYPADLDDLPSLMAGLWSPQPSMPSTW